MEKIKAFLNKVINLFASYFVCGAFTFIACTIGQATFSWGLVTGIWLTKFLFDKFFPSYNKIGKTNKCRPDFDED